MKKNLLFLLTVITAFTSTAQDIDKTKALQLVENNKTTVGLSSRDLYNSIVSSAYTNKTSGTELVYLQQTYQGLPVFNQLLTLAFKNGKVVSKAGSRIQGIERLAGKTSAAPALNAENALRTVLADKKLVTAQQLIAASTSATAKLNFGKAGISKEDITAELMWIPLGDGKEVKLAWQIYVVPANSSDYWLINVGATDSRILGEINLTVYCNFDDRSHQHENACVTQKNNPDAVQTNLINKNADYSPAIVNGASYRVVPYPAESPLHPGGTPALVSNPWTLSPGNATSLKWHSNGTADWTYTRGNNVWAYHDRNNNNAGDPTRSAQSTTSPDPLTFDFAPDFSVAPTQTTPVQNQQFNITNLFYWNNIIHDLVYQYGFDEVAGNFQSNNQGRGGAGNDHVRAEAQDGSGTNNANFATPADGGSGVMQMYLWNGTPQKDGDVDNGVVVHEFGHGISNRLAGGPAQAACVSNAEQMGEGWSDYYSLMATQDWASSLLTDGFNKPRGIGTYAIGQPPTGAGIRSQRYCTNFSINNRSYAATIPGTGQQHNRGEIWCATLWDMTWNIINQVGSINPNIFDASGAGGNSIALKLVTEGLKLQGCNAGFIDARNGILAADQVLYNGAYRCSIMAAFARRGMGFDAIQGSANSTTDQVPGFSTVESILTLTQSVTQQLEGLNVTYNNKVSAGACSGLTNYLLTDTLPANVTYVSGGTYNAGTRVVSYAVNLAAGQTQNYAFTVQVNNGSWFPSVDLINETVAGAGIPASWNTSGTNSFIVNATQSHSTPNAFFAANSNTISDFSLATVTPVALGTTPPTLSFWHSFDTEDGWDGGVAEISLNGGTTWQDLGNAMTENGYNGSMGTGSNNPLGGRSAFTGNSSGFIKTTVSLAAFANQNALFRFRAASDDNTAVTGWFIDDILVQSQAVVNMRSSLMNASGVRMNVKDTFTIILNNVVCSPAAISTQPAAISSCSGSNASFTAAATGTSPSYQWQVSTDGGATYSNITGANGAALTLAAVTAAMSNNLYRVVVSNLCPSSITSSAAALTVTPLPIITQQPADKNVCLNAGTSIVASATGNNLVYQWQVSNNGSFTNITNTAPYSGTNTDALNISPVSSALNNNQYRLVINSGNCSAVTSVNATLTLSLLQAVVLNIQNSRLTPSQSSVITSAVTPAGNYTYQWFRNGSILTGVTASSYPVDVDRLGSYSLTVVDANGCSVSSNSIVVTDSASSILFIYPNPNNGNFQVRYFNAGTGNADRTLTVYDAKGARVYSKKYSIGAGYSRMNVVLTNVQSGVYSVDLRDNKGKRIASGSVVVQ